MTLRRLSEFSLAALFLMTFAGISHGISGTSGEGYFGLDSPPPPYSIISDLPSVTIPNYTPEKQTQTPEPDPIPKPIPKTDPGLERKSEDPDKVIPSYGLDETTTLDLIDLHHSAKRANSKRERYDRYVMIFSDYPKDYLAAYEASRNAYDMAEYDKALHWVNKAIEILPQYVPARQFRRKIEGGLKRIAD